MTNISGDSKKNSGFLSEKNPQGHTVSEYLARISGDNDSGKNAGDERKVFYTALFFLNQEIEEEINSREKELVLLKRIKATIVKGIIPFSSEIAEQFDELTQKNI